MVGLQTTEPPPPVEDPRQAKAEAMMQKARDAARAGEYPGALQLIANAEKLVPGIDADGMAEAVRKAQGIAEALGEARALMEAQRFDEARAKLDSIPEGSARSTEAKQKLREELEEKEAAFRLQQVEELFARRDVETVRPLIDKLPVASRALYLGKLGELEAELLREVQQADRQERVTKGVAVRRSKEKRAEFLVAAFGDVERKFHAGDYERAALECDRVVEANRGDKDVRDRARKLKQLIPQFKRNFEDAQRKFKANSLEASVKPLRKAAELYQQIGFGGSMVDTINEQLATAALAAGKAALARNDVGTAGSHYREALRLNPNDTRAQAGLEKLQGKLEELYLQAYIQRDRDPKAAAEKFRTVIEFAPDGSEVRRKAEEHLSQLQP
jgi:tetratricopeptide (TPR) repeat protein